MVLFFFFFFSSRRRHTRSTRDWSSDVCSSDLSCNSICATLPKIAIQLLPEFEPGSQQPGLHRGNRNADHFGGFFGGKFFDVPQYKNDPEIRREVVDGLRQDFVHFRLSKPLLRAWPPVL